MGYKSRGGYAVNECFRQCSNRSEENCNECVCSRLFKPMEASNGVSGNLCNVQGMSAVDQKPEEVKKG